MQIVSDAGWMIGDFLITHQFMIVEPDTTDTGMDARLEQKHGQDSIQHTDVLPYLKSKLSISLVFQESVIRMVLLRFLNLFFPL